MLTMVRLVKSQMVFTAENPGALVLVTPELRAGHSSAAEITGLPHTPSHLTPPSLTADRSKQRMCRARQCGKLKLAEYYNLYVTQHITYDINICTHLNDSLHVKSGGSF